MDARVLLVEDNEALAQGVSTLLKMEGAHVDVLLDGRETVGMVAHSHPDIVVLDVGLHGIDGIVIARALRDAWPELPIIFATGNAENEVTRRIVLDRRTAVLQKPYSIDMLINMINAVTLQS
jgi:DNA-binding response OmpR family regulator